MVSPKYYSLIIDNIQMMFVFFPLGCRAGISICSLPRGPCSAARFSVLVRSLLSDAFYAGDWYTGKTSIYWHAYLERHVVWSFVLFHITVWQHRGHNHCGTRWVPTTAREHQAQILVSGRSLLLLLPDGSFVGHWSRLCVFFLNRGNQRAHPLSSPFFFIGGHLLVHSNRLLRH